MHAYINSSSARGESVDHSLLLPFHPEHVASRHQPHVVLAERQSPTSVSARGANMKASTKIIAQIESWKPGGTLCVRANRPTRELTGPPSATTNAPAGHPQPWPSSKQERKRGELADEPQQEGKRAPTGTATGPQRGTDRPRHEPDVPKPSTRELKVNAQTRRATRTQNPANTIDATPK